MCNRKLVKLHVYVHQYFAMSSFDCFHFPVVDMLDMYFDRLSMMPSAFTSGTGSHPGSTLIISTIFACAYVSVMYMFDLFVECSVTLGMHADFRVSAFHQSYQGVYTNSPLPLSASPPSPISLPSVLSSQPATAPCRLAEYSAFVAKEFAARHTSSLPACPSVSALSLCTNISTGSVPRTKYEGRILLRSDSAFVGGKQRVRSHPKESKKRWRSCQGAIDSDKSDDDGCRGYDAQAGGGEENESDSGGAGTMGERGDLEVEVVVSAVLVFTTATTIKPAATVSDEEETELEGVRSLADSLPLELWR